MQRSILLVPCAAFLLALGGCHRQPDVEVPVENASEHTVTGFSIGGNILAERIPAGGTVNVRVYPVGKRLVSFAVDGRTIKTTLFFKNKPTLDWLPTRIWIDEEFAVHVEGETP